MATIYSFGYKMNGEDQFAVTGPHAPKIFDCRTITNPYSIPALRRKTGRDAEVQEVVWRSPEAKKMIRRAVSYLRANPNGTVAFGCAYGKHRSVACAEMVADFINPRPQVIHTGAAKMGGYV